MKTLYALYKDDNLIMTTGDLNKVKDYQKVTENSVIYEMKGYEIDSIVPAIKIVNSATVILTWDSELNMYVVTKLKNKINEDPNTLEKLREIFDWGI